MAESTGGTDLAEYDPQNAAERSAAAAAVYEHRQREERESVMDDVTKREAAILELAFQAGWSEALAAVTKAIGNISAAETLSASAVRSALSSPHISSSPRLIGWPKGRGKWGPPDLRVQRIVLQAKRLIGETK